MNEAITTVSLHDLVDNIESDLADIREAGEDLTTNHGEPHECPECDFTGKLPSVRAHITSKDDDDHDWEQLAEEVQEQAESEVSYSPDFEHMRELLDDAEKAPSKSFDRLQPLGEIQELATRSLTEFEDLEDAYADRMHDKELVEEKIDEWGGAEFKIKKGTWDSVGQVNHETRKQGNQLGTDDQLVQMDLYQRNYVGVMVVDSPPNAPDNAEDYPPAIGQWLYEKADSWNSKGDTSAGNSLLRQDLKSSSD